MKTPAVILASQTRDATFHTGPMVCNGRGMKFFLDITAKNGTPTLDVSIDEFDELSQNWIAMPSAAFAQKSNTGTDSLTIYPGCVGVANRIVNNTMPRTYRVVFTIGGSGSPSFTMTLGGEELP